MAQKNVWFVTGAGRGMGVDIVKAALAAGHAVIATGRNTDACLAAPREGMVPRSRARLPSRRNATLVGRRKPSGRGITRQCSGPSRRVIFL